MHTATGTLTPCPPFDFAQSLRFLGMFTPMLGEQAIEGQTLTKAVMITGQPVAFAVTSIGSTEAPMLEYTLTSHESLSEQVVKETRDRIGFFLGLEDDLRPFYALGREDPAFAPVLDTFYGYHQVKFATPFEIACWAILTQRTPMPTARKSKHALTERYGGSVAVRGIAHWAFPEPGALAVVAPEELAEVAGNARKGPYLSAAAHFFDATDERWLRTANYGEVEARLRRVAGIGAWSANFILIRGLGRMEQIPVGEQALERVVSQRYGHGTPVAEEQLRALAERFGPWQGYWAHYLRISG
jgi:DNA-3-methyladenine glycosylase II